MGDNSDEDIDGDGVDNDDDRFPYDPLKQVIKTEMALAIIQTTI